MSAGLSVKCPWCHVEAGVRCHQWRWNNRNPKNVRIVGPRRASHQSRIRAEKAPVVARPAAQIDRWWAILAWHRAGRPGTISDFVAAGGGQ